MTRLQFNDILSLESRTRANLINTLGGFRSANLVGTCNEQGQTNLAIFNSVVHIGANPPLVGFVLRPLTVPRHTYQNIKDTGVYTINSVHEGIYEQAHQTSAKYEEAVSEFEACGFQAEYTGTQPAPYVKESTIKFGVAYQEEYLIKANGTVMVIGKIIEIIIPEGILEPDGFIDQEKAKTVSILGLDAYYATKNLKRLPYARP